MENSQGKQGEPVAFLIFYDDRDRAPEVFAGEGAKDAAMRRYKAISDSWNAHLFVKIDSNSRDAWKLHTSAPTIPEGWREFIESVSKQKPEKPDYWSTCMQCERNISNAEDLLSAAPKGEQP